MSTDRSPRRATLDLALDAIPLLVGAQIAWRVAATMLARVDHGFDLEWMEGGMLGHAWQLVHGRPVYPDPGIGHVAFVYPPGYTVVVAALSSWFGLDYPLGRAISIAGTAAASIAIAVGGARQGGHWAPGLCGAALYLALYNASGAFYDLVRPDALGVALLAWAVVIGLERRSGSAEASGLLLACAFAVKHNLAIFGIPLLAFQWLALSRERGLRFALASIGPALLFTGWMQWVSGGNFLRFLIAVPGSHGLNGPRAFPGTPLEFVQYLMPGLVGAAIYLGIRARTRVGGAALALPAVAAAILGIWAPDLVQGGLGPEQAWARHLGFAALGAIAGCLVAVPIEGVAQRQPDPRWITGSLFAALAFGIGMLMRAHIGGFVNVLMPLHWMTCFGLAVLAGRARNLWPTTAPGITAGIATASLFWASAQLELDRLVPTAEDTAAGWIAVGELEACPPGPIYSPFAAWLPVKAGREPSAHLIGVWDINYEYGPFLGSIEVFERAAADGTWGCVVQGGKEKLGNGVSQHYRYDHRIPIQPGAMMPKTGWRARPTAIHLYVPGNGEGR